MKLRKKPKFSEMPKPLASETVEVVTSLYERFARYINKMSKAGFLMLVICIFLGLFIFFRWVNRGQVDLVASGDNIINMTIMMLMYEFLDQLWDFNGEESMGWGGM